MLFGSMILEVAIGVIFLYLLLSLICSGINEWIAGILKWRSQTLRQGIQNLLTDPHLPGLADSFFQHPLIRGLSPKDGKSFPSYIPAQTFSQVLIDITAGGAEAELTTFRDVYLRVRDQLADLSKANSPFVRTISYLIASAGVDPRKLEDTAKSLQQLEKTRSDLLDFINKAGNDIRQIETAAATLEKLKELEASLRATEEEALTAVSKAQVNVENYFDEAMDRVSGWYKRRVQVVLLVLATIVTLLLNVDTITIAGHLMGNATMRDTIVAAAEQAVTAQPGGTASTPTEAVSQLVGQIDQLGYPIGWSGAMPQGVSGWVGRAVGWLITIVAASMGAPFWFDLLNKLVNVRMTGRKPEEPEK